MKPHSFAILCCLPGLCLPAISASPSGEALAVPGTVQDKVAACPVHFVTDVSLAPGGDLWVATETEGVWRLKAGEEEWRSVSREAGFPAAENVYALACERNGRVWAGTGRSGVAVWNGKEWKTYNRLNGPVGERVFDLAVNPVTGEVGMATSAGLSFYDPSKRRWRDVTRAEGLAEDQVQALAYAPDGTLYAAYQTSGVGWSVSGGVEKDWMQKLGPWDVEEKDDVAYSAELKGTGLPSNECNAVAVAGNGTVWVGTRNGLACGKRDGGGMAWSFIRGRDAVSKTAGLAEGGKAENGKRKSSSSLLPEDYVTALQADRQGVWVGFRFFPPVRVDASALVPQAGWEGADGRQKDRNDWISSFLRLPDGRLLAATYGAGLRVSGRTGTWRAGAESCTDFPMERPAPDEGQLNGMREELFALGGGERQDAVFSHDDWQTAGDWPGRYGRDGARLCGTDDWRAGMEGRYEVLNPCFRAGTVAGNPGWNYCCTYFDRFNSPDINDLYDPYSGTRSTAELNDAGHEYAASVQGPDLWVGLPFSGEGVYRVAFYFYNYNGRKGRNGDRDYSLEIRKGTLGEWERFRSSGDQGRIPYGDVASRPVLARARVTDFAGGGVYKNFIARGDSSYFVRIKRNGSLNVILGGIFVDRLDVPNAGSGDVARMEEVDLSVAPGDMNWGNAVTEQRLWCSAASPFLSPRGVSLARQAMLACCRSVESGGKAPDELRRVLHGALPLWVAGEREAFRKAMEQDWERLLDEAPFRRSAAWNRHSPGTIPFSVDEVQKMASLGIDWRQYRADAKAPPSVSVEEMKKILAGKK